MNYRNEELSAVQSYAALASSSPKLLEEVLSAEEKYVFPSRISKTAAAEHIKNIVTCAECKLIEQRRRMGEQFYQPGKSPLPATSGISLKGGRLKLSGISLELFKNFAKSLRK